MSEASNTRPTVLTRRPPATLGAGVLTFVQRTRVDAELAAEQHARYRTALLEQATSHIDLEQDDRFPDSVFVEDALLAFPECFVLCRPGVPSRAGEPDLLVDRLPLDRPVIRIVAPATIDGGDVLQIGRRLFVGLSTRTNTAAVSQLDAALRRFGYQVTAVRVAGSLHLKTAVTAPRDDLLLVNRAWVDLAPFESMKILDVDSHEPFASNVLRIGERVFTQAACPRTAARLQQAGIGTFPLDISEFAKMEAGLTCMSVVIPPPA